MWISNMVEPVGKISIAPRFPVPSLVLQLGALVALSHNTLSQLCLRTVPCYGPKGIPLMGLRTGELLVRRPFLLLLRRTCYIVFLVSSSLCCLLSLSSCPPLNDFLPGFWTNGFIQPLTPAWPIEPSPDPALMPQRSTFRCSCLSQHLFGPGLLTPGLLSHPGLSVLFNLLDPKCSLIVPNITWQHKSYNS